MEKSEHVVVNGARLFVRDTGGEGPAVVFSHGLLMSHAMFDHQVAALRSEYRCIAYDHRGQGRSDVPQERCITIDTVAEDAAALIETLGAGPCHFVGLSMGGYAGMRIAARRPDLLRSLTLIATSADAEPVENLPKYRLMRLVTQLLGPWAVQSRVLPIMFGKTFLEDPARAAERALWAGRLRGNKRSVVRAVSGVLSRDDFSGELGKIECPALLLHGAEDMAIAASRMDALHAGIPNARLARIPKGGHSLTVEAPAWTTAEIQAFLRKRG